MSIDQNIVVEGRALILDVTHNAADPSRQMKHISGFILLKIGVNGVPIRQVADR